MGRRCTYEISHANLKCDEIGEDAVREAAEALDRLIAKNPDLAAFQKEIERRLRMAGVGENRTAVLCIMIESHLTDLARQMRGLLSLIA